MGTLWYFLLMAGVGVVIGIIIVIFKRSTLGKVKGLNISRLKSLEKKWFNLSEDLKLVKDLGVDLSDKFPGATPERVEKVKELSRKFEGAWFRTKDASPGTNMMETVTTYELERILEKIDDNLKLIFKEK